MIKLMFLISSLFINFHYNNFEFIEEEINDNIIVSEDGYKVLDNGKLVYGSETLYTFSPEAQVKLHKDNNLYVVSVLNGVLNIKVFDKFNRMIHDENIPGKFINNFDIVYLNEKLVIVSGITIYDGVFQKHKKPYFDKTDAIIFSINQDFEIDSIKIYGGSMDEYFSKIKIIDSNFYLIGRKDTLSGGDFGYGGSKNYGYLCVKTNQDFALEKYCTVKEKIYDVATYENNTFLLCENNIYNLNSELETQSAIPLDQNNLGGVLTSSKLAAIIYENKLELIDLEYENVLAYYPLDKVSDFRIIDGKFVFDHKSVTVLDLRNFCYEHIYDGSKVNETINNLFYDIELTKTTSEPTFDPLVYGQYNIDYYYGDYKVSGIVIVPFEANVSNNIIYPLGYRLLFTGIAYLDGELINNNHAIMSQGNHELVLYSCNGDKKEIQFKVDKDQIPFTENKHKEWNIVTYPNQDYNIIIHHPYIDYKIESIIINNNFHYDYKLNPQELVINICENSPGIKKVCLQEVTFIVGEEKLTKKLNTKYIVNVLNNSLVVEGDFTDDKKNIYFDGLVTDPDAEIRGVNVKVVGSGEEIYFRFPICDRNLRLSSLSLNKNYECTINLEVDEGDGVLKDFPLFNFNVFTENENVSIGEINIIQKGQTLEKFKITIKKDKTVPLVFNDNRIIYEYQKPSYQKVVTVSLISGIIITCIVYFIKRNKKIA